MAAPQVLLTDLVIGESGRWHEGRLWFSNWGAQEIVAVDLAGKSEVMLRVPTTIPFSVDWLLDGRLLIVSGQEGLLLRQERDGLLVTHADLTSLSPYPWHEIVVDSRGNIYVNSICFDFMGGQQPRPGIIALVTPDGAARQMADGLAFPNGMVITPDNRTLIVAESMGNQLTAFTIAEDGSLSQRRVWADLASDGICLDAEGALWCPADKSCLRVREGGEILQTITLDRNCFACMLGGDDRRTLFMLAAEWRGVEHMTDGPRSGQVLTAKAPVPGAGWP